MLYFVINILKWKVNTLIDKSKPIPLYFQVKEDLMEKIKKGQFKVNDLIPSETELQEQYDVSRITIRRAIQELVQEGLLSTQQGKGTYVSEPKASQELNLISSWAETISNLGMNHKSSIISLTKEPAPLAIAQLLNIQEGEVLYKLERVRFVNQEPICLMTNYLLPACVPGFLENGLVRESLYETLEKDYNIVLNRADEVVEAKAAKAREANLLEIKRGTPLLHATRVTYDLGNRPIEAVITITRGDRYSYKIKLVGRKNI